MGLITESYLRQHLPELQKAGALCLSKGDKLTPSAHDFLVAHHIDIIQGASEPKERRYGMPRSGGEWKTPEQYKILYDGKTVDSKPEAMTHLYENVLVYKDDPRIILRGRLDTLQAHIVMAQASLSHQYPQLTAPLEELLAFTRMILGHEVLNKEVPDIKILGLSMEELKEHSHNPEKYFGMKQMVLVSHEDGPAVASLNFLRAQAREIELVAVASFRQGGEITRNDIVLSLNRLSSAFHLLMYRELSQNSNKRV